MLRLLLLLSAAAISAAKYDGPAPPRAHQLDGSYTFEQYLAHFDKSYDDPGEYERRSGIFAENMKKILSHNEGRMTEAGDVIEGYVMGVNMFTDVPSHELPFGYNKALHPAWRSQLAGGATRTERLLADAADGSYAQPLDFELEDVESLPESVDWQEEGHVDKYVSYQGNVCGSCWAFAATEAIQSHLSIATGNEPFTLSVQNMFQCAPNPKHCGGKGGCKGSTVELGLDYIADISTTKNGGMYKNEDIPYDKDAEFNYKDAFSNQGCESLTEGKSPTVGIKGWTQLPSNSYTAMMNAIAKVGPVAVATASIDWPLYEKGVFSTEQAKVNHAVLLVGYGVDEHTGEKYYKIKNSWGANFGEDGYIRIKRTDDDDKVCKIDTDPLEGTACRLDDNGNEARVDPVQVCGMSALLFDGAYPVGVYNIGGHGPSGDGPMRSMK